MHQKLTYSLDKNGMCVQGKTIDTKLSWFHLVTWQVRGDWLILKPSGGPQMFFPVSKMKSEGIFDDIMGLVKQHGKEFK